MSVYLKTLEDYKQKYVAFAALTILGQSCLGSVAAMYILTNGTSLIQIVQLGLAVTLTMTVNTAIISCQKPKIVFDFLLWSVAINTLLIIANTLFI